MYVGYGDSDRLRQLQSLETLLSGYALALRAHGLTEVVGDFNRELSAYLRQTRGWSSSSGPVAAVRDAAHSDADAWTLCFRLVDEYRAHLVAPKGEPWG